MSEDSPLPAPDDTLAETRLFWRDVGRQLVKESIPSVDETAKQIVGVAGLLAGIYFHAILFSGLRGQVDFIEAVVYGSPVFLFLLGLVAALLVFFPDRYRINVTSGEEGKKVYERVITTKLLLLQLAALLLAAGVGASLFALMIYLLM